MDSFKLAGITGDSRKDETVSDQEKSSPEGEDERLTDFAAYSAGVVFCVGVMSCMISGTA